MGPLPVISMVISPLIRGYNPSYPIIRPFIRVITPFITSRGPPCSDSENGVFRGDVPNLLIFIFKRTPEFSEFQGGPRLLEMTSIYKRK